MLASQGSTQIMSLLTSIVIAHLLLPREVGLAAEAGVFGTLALVIADFGVAAVIVQRPTLSEEDRSSAFWATIALGVLLTLVGVGASWPVALLYGQSRVQPLFAVLSLTFLITSPGIVQGALLNRELRFRALEVRGMIATGAGCTSAVLLAAFGAGPWAIIIQSLTVSGVSTLLLWRSSSWRPKLIVSMPHLRGMAGFAGHTFGARALTWAVLNLDNLLVGRFLGAAPLGAYALACSIALAPLTRIAAPITQVFFPAFSRIEDPRRIGAVWLRALRMVAVLVVPVMLGAVAVAHEAMRVVFGPRWLPAAPVLQVLALIGLMQALTALNSGILNSRGQARTLFRVTMVTSAVSVMAFAAGLPWGIRGVAVAYLAASLLVQPAYTAITAHSVGLRLSDCLAAILGVLEAGGGMLLVVLGARALLINADVPPLPRLVACVVLGAISYGALVLWRAPEARAEVTALRRRRVARSEGASSGPAVVSAELETIAPEGGNASS
jgi:O-antigen/teichoic acid export membrane protein